MPKRRRIEARRHANDAAVAQHHFKRGARRRRRDRRDYAQRNKGRRVLRLIAVAVAVTVGTGLAGLPITIGDRASPGEEGRFADFVFDAEVADRHSAMPPLLNQSPPRPFLGAVARRALTCHGCTLPESDSGSSLPRPARCDWPDGKEVGPPIAVVLFHENHSDQTARRAVGRQEGLVALARLGPVQHERLGPPTVPVARTFGQADRVLAVLARPATTALSRRDRRGHVPERRILAQPADDDHSGRRRIPQKASLGVGPIGDHPQSPACKTQAFRRPRDQLARHRQLGSEGHFAQEGQVLGLDVLVADIQKRQQRQTDGSPHGMPHHPRQRDPHMAVEERRARRSRRRVVVNARALDFRPVAFARRVVDGQQDAALRSLEGRSSRRRYAAQQPPPATAGLVAQAPE